MRKLAALAMLFGVTVFTIGCDTPADKKAKDEKKAIQADTDANKAKIDAEAKKADADMDADKAVEKAQQKKADAAKDAADADAEETNP